MGTKKGEEIRENFVTPQRFLQYTGVSATALLWMCAQGHLNLKLDTAAGSNPKLLIDLNSVKTERVRQALVASIFSDTRVGSAKLSKELAAAVDSYVTDVVDQAIGQVTGEIES